MSKQLVIYHGGCYDGFTAAWVCKQAMPEAELIPATYGQGVVDISGVEELYIVDFSYPREILLEMSNMVPKLVVLDHHKTAQANCEGLDFCTFDMERSGAGLAWDYFYPDQPRPKLVNYVEDRDLWRFREPFSQQIHCYISSFAMTFHNWDTINGLLEQDFDHCVTAGSQILRYDDLKVVEMCKEVQWKTIEGYEVPVVNCPIQFGSKVGHLLLGLYPDAAFSAYYSDAGDGSQRWGLRGRSEDNFDVSEIAKVFGGGGHKKASGFVLPGTSGRAIYGRN